MKLESALARLRTDRRIAVLHYAPIRATVENEPVEIFPFLGCSRLEDPLNRYPVTAVVHGHAHNGCPEGRTSAGVPVYNVALPLLRKTTPDQPPFRILNHRESGPGIRDTGDDPEPLTRCAVQASGIRSFHDPRGRLALAPEFVELERPIGNSFLHNEKALRCHRRRADF